jgi:two-component system OmpR family response regulator
MHRPGETVSKNELLDHVWDPSAERDPNVVEVYVGYLRRKLDRQGEPSHIETVRSFGYRLAGQDQAAGGDRDPVHDGRGPDGGGAA